MQSTSPSPFTRAPLWRGLLLCLIFLISTPAPAEVAVPPLENRVTDLTGTLSPSQQAQLDEKLRALEQRKGSQIAILLLPTTEPESIEQYGLRVAEQWKLGRKGVDDGLLIVAALQDRSLRLEVGYGLEGVVPDAIAKRVISEIMTPSFRQGDYFGGLVAGVDQLARLIDGEPLPAPEPQQSNHSEGSGNGLFSLIFAAFVLSGVLRAIFGQLLGATLVSTLIGVAAWLIFGSLIFALLAALFAFIFALASGSRGGTGFGGGGFGGGGFGGGGGGFSGGGGGFGGGGASGRW